MRDSRIIALFGKSCVGKSVVVAKLAIRLSLDVRHCGELVKARARQLGVSVDALPEAEHQAIDDETLSLATKADTEMIMEGSFLDIVLAEVPKATFFELICEDDERRRRYAGRSSGANRTMEFRDQNDLRLRSELWRIHERTSNAQLKERVSIDTTRLTPDEVVSLLSESLRNPS